MQSNIPVVLSHLNDLTLSRLAFADSSNVHNRPQHPTLVILRHIRFPSCTKFTLRTSIERESTIDPEDLRGLLPSPLDILAHPSSNDLQTSQKPRGYLTAAFSEDGLTLTMAQEPGGNFTYEVKLDRTPRSISRRWLKSALEDRPGVTLQGFKLHVYIYEYSQMDDLVAFQASEAVTLLSVEIGDGGLGEGVVRRLLQILATPYTSASGITVMAFPRLLGMEVDGWEFRGEAVLEMIKSRFGTPGVEAHRPEFITVNSGHRHREFWWDSLDEICELGGSTAIHFGAIDSWPSSSPRPGSPESVWPPFDDEGSSVTGEDDWNLDPEAELHGVWEEEEGSLSSAETDDS
ncbi:hypothetical protein FRC05_002207 [Tulasnella sp. 425]|nr:hypothetical protein FRC05_002207 [Tulasnella sp. 425]